MICSTSPTGSSTCCHPAFLDMRCGVTQPRPPGETPPQPSRCPPRYPLSLLSRVLSCTGSVLSTHSCLATSLTVQASEFYNVVGRCASLGRVQKKQWTLTPAEGTNQFITIAYTHTKETRCVCARVCVCDSVCVIVCV